MINLNQKDLSPLLDMLSKMDSSQLQKGLEEAAKVLNSNDKDKIIQEIQKKTKQ